MNSNLQTGLSCAFVAFLAVVWMLFIQPAGGRFPRGWIILAGFGLVFLLGGLYYTITTEVIGGLFTTSIGVILSLIAFWPMIRGHK